MSRSTFLRQTANFKSRVFDYFVVGETKTTNPSSSLYCRSECVCYRFLLVPSINIYKTAYFSYSSLGHVTRHRTSQVTGRSQTTNTQNLPAIQFCCRLRSPTTVDGKRNLREGNVVYNVVFRVVICGGAKFSRLRSIRLRRC